MILVKILKFLSSLLFLKTDLDIMFDVQSTLSMMDPFGTGTKCPS